MTPIYKSILNTAVLTFFALSLANANAAVKKAGPRLETSAAEVTKTFDAANANILTFGGGYYFTGRGAPVAKAAYDIFLTPGFSLAPRLGVLISAYALPTVGVRASFWPTRAYNPAATQVRIGVGSDLLITGGYLGTPVILYTSADLGIQFPLSDVLVMEIPLEVGLFPLWTSAGVMASAGLQLGFRL